MQNIFKHCSAHVEQTFCHQSLHNNRTNCVPGTHSVYNVYFLASNFHNAIACVTN
jgi:hypothetical protein